MKEPYTPPAAEMIEFNSDDIIATSNIPIGHGDMGHGFGLGSGCDHDPGHGNPKKPHPNSGG